MSRVNIKENNTTTDSDASVENGFRIVKHSILNSESRIKAADFIRSIYVNIDVRIAAFKFASTRLASKVFKPKKRKIQVEDEENYKEEWSKRKKTKLSYTSALRLLALRELLFTLTCTRAFGPR